MNKNYFKSKRVIITGGTGFVGSYVLTEILNQSPSKVLLISRGSKTDRIKKHLSRIDLKVYNSSREYIKYIVDFNAEGKMIGVEILPTYKERYSRSEIYKLSRKVRETSTK